ncbi:MAG: hydroxyethylthiazole kinase [Desulfocapsaceae bacterium]|jgi:hydroxyethylthiazole kinase|nr:hydroxyethylthiazole kinase [Desulfocapsaceae bacterium]
MSTIAEKTAENLQLIRQNKPLVHNITNFVVMNFTANALLALGASPVMAHAREEVEEMVSYAGALVLNIGTLSDIWIESMIKAGRKATKIGTPIILDPVGSGATGFRTASAKRLLAETVVGIIRGNSSEILSLGDPDSMTKGVDAMHTVDDAAEISSQLARDLGTTLAITGPVDLITDGSRVLRVANGDAMMPSVTGTGCAATAIIGAFAAVEKNMVDAAAGGLAFIGLAGEKAAQTSSGPGSFMIAMLDTLYNLTPEELEAGSRITEA